MTKDLFNRWITNGTIEINDIIPILVEWNHTFGNGKATEQTAQLFCSVVQTDYLHMLDSAIRDLAVHNGFTWTELRDKDGNLIRREFYEEPK